MDNRGKKAFVDKTKLVGFIEKCGDTVDLTLLQDFIKSHKTFKSTSKRKYEHCFAAYCKSRCRCKICKLAVSLSKKYRTGNKDISIELTDEIANTCISQYIHDISPQHREFYKYIEARFNIQIKKPDNQNKTES